MANFNRVILLGNLTRDPQLKYLPSNTAVCEFGLAVNRRWRDRDGNQKDDVCFIDIEAFGKQGEVINQYMHKGSAILIEGRLKLDAWTGQDGQKRSKHRVVVENFTFVGGPREASSGAPAERSGNWNAAHGAGAPPADAGPPDTGPSDEAPPSGDTIPF